MGINVGQLSLWQVSAYWAGYVQAQGGETMNTLSDDEVEEIGRWLDS
jgi:hypothetical protein